MQFLVPQFIDVESKIIGPISVRQFIILLVAAGIDFLSFQLTTNIIAGIIIFFVTSIACLFAFGKVNTQPMHYFVLNLTQTLRRPRLRIWHRAEYVERKINKEVDVTPIAIKPMVSQSRLAEMSLLVDTGGSYGVASEQMANTSGSDYASRQTKQISQSQKYIQLKELNLDKIKDLRLYGEK